MANNIADTLDLLRVAIEDLNNFKDLNQPTDGEYTDIACRVNALTGDLGEANDAIKSKIKVDLLSVDKTISEGQTFLAILNRVTVKRLDMDRVKNFLGKRLSSFQVENQEVRLTFKPKG